MPLSTARCAARWLAVLFCFVYSSFLLAQSTGGRILGRVADPSGAVLANVKVTAVNEATGVSQETQTSGTGDYGFPQVAVGTYRLEFDLAGFKKNVQRGVNLDLNQVITLNMIMQIGETQETVEVTSEAPLVDTTSTQLGAVVNDRSVNGLPLNARDTYQFLQLQPGVQSQLGGNADVFYGSGSAGAVSVNGGRGRSNNFSVNGGDANDMFANLPTVQPTPDAIEEFRVLTNTFDAEYGRNSGAVVNVVTKSGTNKFHGNVYEYFRNKVLNARGYFDTSKPDFKQNQFGGTFGGPIKKDHTFFFTSYEGRRIRQGKSTDTIALPTDAERAGDFSANGAFGGSIVDHTVADLLNGRTGCATAIAAIPGSAAPASGVSWGAVFPTSKIPVVCQDPVAADLLKYVPHLPQGASFFQAVPTGSDRQDQFTMRLDHRLSSSQNLNVYYYFTDESLFQPLAFFQAAGANVPGFGSNVGQRYQQWNISHTWTLRNDVVNEARFTYMREGQKTFQHPQHTNLVTDSCSSSLKSICFTGQEVATALGIPFDPKLGITPNLGPTREGVPDIAVSGGFTIGNNFEGELPQVGNSFQWTDSLTKVHGNHTFKFGADVRRQRFDQTLYFEVSGYFQYTGTGQNDVVSPDFYPDYLLGLPDNYQQGSAQHENVRATGVYLFAQDSWKVRPNLTLNYGLRWELNTPLTDIGHHVQVFRPGQSSTIYPCLQTSSNDCSSETPVGLVVPGDKGVPAGLTQTYYKAFAPRIGISWSPGTSGKTSIRAGFGMFYNPIEQLVLEQFSAEPPFGGSTFLSNPFFNAPFYAQGGFANPNAFNGILNPTRGQPVDWSVFRPILLFGEFEPHMRAQYSDQYNLTIQRQLAKEMVLQVSYVGSQGHRLLATHELNAANPQTCLDINNVATNVTSFGTPGNCGPGLEDNQFSLTVPQGQVFHMPNGSTVTGATGGTNLQFVGLRPHSSPQCDALTGAGCPPDGVPVFSNIYAQDTIANSAYNSLQASLEKRFSHGLQAQVAYTFSKSLDQASSFEEILNPFNFGRTRGLSLFDSRHRLVLSYYWELPVRKYSGLAGALLNNWALSQITTLQSGFPIHIESFDDQELTASVSGFASAGEPDLQTKFRTSDPHRGGFCAFGTGPESGTGMGCQTVSNSRFDPNIFTLSPLGQFGNSPRTVCCGNGTSNTDFAVHKTIPLTEGTRFEFRAEFFNVFNHTQFFNPDGSTTDGADFGRVKRAHDPRLVQFALKYFF
jgi:hypothetical protein